MIVHHAITSRGPAPDLHALASAADVSVPTASLALSGHARVSSRTRERVRLAAARIGYVPNQAGRRLAHARRDARARSFDHVGFILHGYQSAELDRPYLSVMRGVEERASSLGAAMVFLRVSSPGDEAKVTRLAGAGWVDGWLMAGVPDEQAIRRLTAAGGPCVLLGVPHCPDDVSGVDIDYPMMGRLAAEHLASLGHRRIGFIGARMRFNYQTQTLAGFRAAVRDMGLDSDPALVQTNEFGPLRSLQARLQTLLSLTPAPTAIVTSEPSHAGEALDVLRSMGVDVPGRVSLLSCDYDTPGHPWPELTRIDFPFASIGSAGAALLRQLAADPTLTPRRELVQPALTRALTCQRPQRD